MTTMAMFPVTEAEIAKPIFIYDPDDFLCWFNSLAGGNSPHATSNFNDALANLRDHVAAGKFAVVLIWPDGEWSVVYDSARSRVEVWVGVRVEAYRGSQRDEHFKPVDGRTRRTWSSGREGF